MGCFCSTSKNVRTPPGYEDPTVLASETPCEYPSSSLTGNSVPPNKMIYEMNVYTKSFKVD